MFDYGGFVKERKKKYEISIFVSIKKEEECYFRGFEWCYCDFR